MKLIQTFYTQGAFRKLTINLIILGLTIENKANRGAENLKRLFKLKDQGHKK